MPGLDRSEPLPVKHWTFAGLLLTYWCNARCASCYVCASPHVGRARFSDAWGRAGEPAAAAAAGAGEEMTVEAGLAFWEGLQGASPHGCRIHIGGGEPFGRWERLIELARRAKAAGLGPLEAVETNAFWAADEPTVRDRAAALDDAGMGRLTISADPYHQQFVPIERVRLAARVAAEVLGGQRVRLRWRDWAEQGYNTDRLTDQGRSELFACYAARGRDRISGRAASELAAMLPLRPAEHFAGSPCRQRLLRSRHVHVDGDGRVCPGTCAGIVLGRAAQPSPAGRAEGPPGAAPAATVGEIWRGLRDGFADMDVVGPLAAGGPMALVQQAVPLGFAPSPRGYAGTCHVCWDVRRWLFENGHYPDRLGPARIYRP